MQFHILTSVWGEFHWKIFLDAALPNVLSRNNIPKLSEEHDVLFRFFTTRQDQAAYESHPLVRLLSGHADVEFVTPLASDAPRPDHHVHWIHRAATEARRAGAAVMILPPDTMWNDGAFAFAGEALSAGYLAVVTPLTQVVQETLIPEAKERFQPSPDSPMTLTGTELVELSLRHLHPVTCLSMPTSPHSRPAIDQYWPVPEEGLVERHSQREMFAFDPGRIPMTFLWYPGAPDADRVAFAEDSDDASMLSLDPLYKSFPTYILNHQLGSTDIAKMSIHPLNDMPLIDFYTSRRVRWHADRLTEQAWAPVEKQADDRFRAVRQDHRLLRIWSAAQAAGCIVFSKLLAVATHVLAPEDKEAMLRAETVLFRTDASLAAEGVDATELVRPSNENRLGTFLRDHMCAEPPRQASAKGHCVTLLGRKLPFSHGEEDGLQVGGVKAAACKVAADTAACLVLDGSPAGQTG